VPLVGSAFSVVSKPTSSRPISHPIARLGACFLPLHLGLSGRFAACFFDVFDFLATFLDAFLGAFAFRAVARSVRLAITHSL